MARPNPFAQAIERFIEKLKELEDPRSPFYQEILRATANLRYHDGTHEQSSASARALQSYIENLDVEQTRRSKTRRVGIKLQPLVDGLMQFTGALDTMIQASPAPAMLIYGTAKLVLGLAQGFAECFDMMVEAMHDIGTMLECYHIFSTTYDSADAMRKVLVDSYENILVFWQKAAKLFTRNGVKTFFKGIVKPFDSEWRTLKSRLELNERQVLMFAQALEGSAAKRREEEAKQRGTQEDEAVRQAKGERMRMWLSGFDETAQIDVRMDLEALQKARHIGTCEWIFEDQIYQKWLASCENENLWLYANPGTGKSVLCSSIIQQLRGDNKKVAFFFCSFQEPLKRKITCALKSLALQLFAFYEDLPSEFERIYEDEMHHGHTKLQNPTVIVMVLQVLLKSLERVHIIVDGLDECENRELTINLLSECFRTSSVGIVKWLWASRIEPDFQRLSAVAKSKFVHIQKAQVDEDIKTFIEDSPEMAGSSHKSVEEWVAASEGNFLWLTLMFRTLTGCDLTCPAEVEEELDRFPKGLKQCYQRVLDQLMKRSKSQQQLARRLFLLVAFAEQPLTLCEVLDALSIGEDAGGVSPNRRPFESLVKQLCCPLILLDSSSKNGRQNLVLRYFHKSTRDFFVQDPVSLGISGGSEIFFAKPAEGHLSMSKICITYLSDERYRTPNAFDPANDSFVDEHCFMRYAALFWYSHFNQAGYSDYLFDIVDNFLRSPNFWSCIRVQGTVAPYLFSRLVEVGVSFSMINPSFVDISSRDYFASPLPNWLQDSERGSLLLKTYLALVREWNPVLLHQPQATLHCHPGVLGIQNIFSTEGIESPNDSILDMQLCEDATRQPDPRDGRPLRQIVGTQPTKTGLKLFSFESRQENSFSNSLLRQWHVNLNAGSVERNLGVKLKRTWEIKSSIKQPILQLRSDEKSHEPATWSFDIKTLLLSVHRDGSDVTFTPPPGIRQSWLNICQSLSSCQKSVHDVVERQAQEDHITILAMTWKIAVQNPGSETDGDELDDSDSDISSDDAQSNRSIFTSDSECRTNRRSGSCFGLVIVIIGRREPVWFNWESTSEITPDFIPACDSKGSVVMWPISKSSVMYADIQLRKSWEIPISNLTSAGSGEPILSDLHYSACGTTWHFLTLTMQHDTTSHHIIYSISLHNLTLTKTSSDNVKLTEASSSSTLARTTYTTRIGPGPAILLRKWSTDWVYLAINSPSSLCTVKLLRLPLSVTESSDLATVQTTSLPIYVPASFSTRSPKIEIVQTPLQEHVAFVLQSTRTEQTPSTSLVPATNSNLNTPTTEAAEDPATSGVPLPPILITHPISRLGSWQIWDPERDGKESGIDSLINSSDYLKGDYAATDQRFSVPIRSGLNWRKAITSTSTTVRVAVTQAEPEWLDLPNCVKKTCKLIEEAAKGGAKLVAFPECWIPGYPAWIWARTVDFVLNPRYIKNSLKVDSAEMETICKAAADYKINVLLGFAENDGNSLYIAQCFIDTHGKIRMRRRKVKPTHMERTVFGDGSGSSLKNVVEAEGLGRVGALACWEHTQPLLKYHTYLQREEIHIAAWPPLDPHPGGPALWSMSREGCQSLSQTYAIESATFVLHCTSVFTHKAIDTMSTANGALFNTPGGGCSAVFGPDGRRLTKEVDATTEEMLYADLDIDLILAARCFVDACGHYSRPDLLWLGVDDREKSHRVSERMDESKKQNEHELANCISETKKAAEA